MGLVRAHLLELLHFPFLDPEAAGDQGGDIGIFHQHGDCGTGQSGVTAIEKRGLLGGGPASGGLGAEKAGMVKRRVLICPDAEGRHIFMEGKNTVPLAGGQRDAQARDGVD